VLSHADDTARAFERRAAGDVTADRPRGFRPAPRARARVAAGVALGAVAIAGNVLVYSGLDDRVGVLQVVRDVPAGAQLAAADLRVVHADVDGSVRAIPAEALSATVGRFAKVRIVAGSLVVTEALQDGPLVSPGAAVVAVQLPAGAVPLGARERSLVHLVLAGDRGVDGQDRRPTVVPGRLVGLPTEGPSLAGHVSLSVEVPSDVAADVAVADGLGLVLLDPSDPAAENGP
jgi:hypothetical protein